MGVGRWPWRALVAALALAGPAAAHETDQYTVPAGQTFADLGDELTAKYYDCIASAVKTLNDRISKARSSRSRASYIASCQSPETLTDAVYDEFEPAYFLIENMDAEVHRGQALRRKHPGRMIGYWESINNIFTGIYFPLDPRQFFRIWHACTIKAYGVYFGTDKLGHFTDMGYVYYLIHRAALLDGDTEEQAYDKIMAEARRGLVLGEEGMLGYLSSGLYSNADLAANWAGYKFYLNLTRPITVNGTLLPPMVVLDGDCWRLSPHVRRNSGFLACFFSNHLNEALNPGVFEPGMRAHVRQCLRDRAARYLEFNVDPNGNRRTPAWFEAQRAELATWFGENYGHRGCGDDVVSVASICFEAPPVDGPQERNAAGWTSLHLAAARGDRVRTLQALEAGADQDQPVRSLEPASADWGSTALHLAAASGSAEVVRLLLVHGATINGANDRGATPLHCAVEHPWIVTLLLEHGADPLARDQQGRSPLHWLAAYPATESARLLVQAGAGVAAADHRGQTPLHLAALADNVPMMEFLLANGTPRDARARFETTPLHFATRAGSRAAVECLLHAGATADADDEFGLRPLHEAAQAGRMEVVSALLAAGARPSAPDRSGSTPLHLAARHGHAAVAAMLLAAGAEVNSPNAQGSRPLHEAAFCARTTMVDLLLAHGADKKARNANGMSPGDIASARGNQVAVLMINLSPAVAPTGIQ